ncbi:hypothetical protein BDK51DRAFT_45490 [Blyttiomyces helicus]|uniref:Myosin motor domain-containing protein n=1 Tax=Blyttiomyces helicus TaxID=388810 RepID=A0A4P9WI21_9FUNG|nr:hypothetical protein BDK51DRAFT_45490 [Blyttiomyces helicus]|eukprot:RKO91625.1 hypothetical protein BDK51DRAFT_45490 [Blyttiomyces helicus]
MRRASQAFSHSTPGSEVSFGITDPRCIHPPDNQSDCSTKTHCATPQIGVAPMVPLFTNLHFGMILVASSFLFLGPIFTKIAHLEIPDSTSPPLLALSWHQHATAQSEPKTVTTATMSDGKSQALQCHAQIASKVGIRLAVAEQMPEGGELSTTERSADLALPADCLLSLSKTVKFPDPLPPPTRIASMVRPGRRSASQADGLSAPTPPTLPTTRDDITATTVLHLTLPALNSDEIVGNLGARFATDETYTRVGSRAVIALNPGRNLPSSSSSVSKDYAIAARDPASPLPAPHVFDLTDAAYLHMLRMEEDQSILLR